jgi:lanosterol synthase
MNFPMKVMNSIVLAWETYLRPTWVQKKANEVVLDLIHREDRNTSYNDLAPVNKAFHMAAVHFAGDTAAVMKHAEKLPTYFWLSGRGMTCGGTNGAQLWDTAFTAIAIVEAGLGQRKEFRPMLEKALHFLDISQFRDNLDDPYRQQRKGGWPFSTHDNGYIVSDCSAEGMKAVLLLQEEW